MTDQQMQEKIKTILDQFRPAIASHGGAIEFVDLKENIVYLKLAGACVSCPASFFTLKLGIEEALREQMPSIQEVVAVE